MLLRHSAMASSSVVDTTDRGEEMPAAAPGADLPPAELDTGGLQELSLDEVAKERARVRGGIMSKLGRVVLFSLKIPDDEEEEDHFSVVPLAKFKAIPPDLTALQKIPQASRCQERVFRYKDGGKWDSFLFARCEEGEYCNFRKLAANQKKTITLLLEVNVCPFFFLLCRKLSESFPQATTQVAIFCCKEMHVQCPYSLPIIYRKLAANFKKTVLPTGLSKDEVNDALLPVRMTYEAFAEKHGPVEAYYKCVRRFQDAIYDAYTYPQVGITLSVILTNLLQTANKPFQSGEKYRLRKLRSNDRKVRVLQEITCPSNTDLNDSDGEMLPPVPLKRGDKNNNKEPAYRDDSGDEHTTNEGGVETVAAASDEDVEEEEEEASEVSFFKTCGKLAMAFTKTTFFPKT